MPESSKSDKEQQLAEQRVRQNLLPLVQEALKKRGTDGRASSEGAYWIDPADELRQEKIVLQSAKSKTRDGTLSAEQLSKELWPALQKRLEYYRHYDSSLDDVTNRIQAQFSAEDEEYFSAVEGLQNQMEEMYEVCRQTESGENAFSSEQRKAKFLEFMDEKIGEAEKEYREQMRDYIEDAYITSYDKQQLLQLARVLPYQQLKQLNAAIQEKGISRVMNGNSWEGKKLELLFDPADYSRTDYQAIASLDGLYNCMLDADNPSGANDVLAHMSEYERRARLRKAGDHSVDIPDNPYHQESGEGYYNSMYQRNADGSFKNGRIMVKSLDERSLYMLGCETIPMLESIKDTVIQLASVNPMAGSITNMMTVIRGLNSRAYCESDPGIILSKGDVQVYYSRSDDGANGTNYYFRGNELLYARNATTMDIEFGEHYFEYVDELAFSLTKAVGQSAASTIMQNMIRLAKKG